MRRPGARGGVVSRGRDSEPARRAPATRRDSSLPPPPLPSSWRRVGTAAFLGTGLVAYGIGVSLPPPSAAGPPTDGSPRADAPEAPTYSALMADEARPTDERQRLAFATLLADRPPMATALATDEERRAEIVRRARLRAYDGAPPRIPHPAREREAPQCLACHEDGMRVAGHVAAEMPHATLVNCTQCHVVDVPSGPRGALGLEGGPPLAGSFAGAVAPERGSRAWPGAPPTVPHPVRMRGECTTCHGDRDRQPALERTVCLQCHAPPAERPASPTRASAGSGGASP